MTELRRRRVFRALVGWAVVSFAVLQVIEPVMHGLSLPDWTLRAAIWALAAGFPVTAALSWLFDLGPGGITRTADVPTLPGPVGGPARPRLALAGLVTASALLGAGLAAVGLRNAAAVPEPGPDGRLTVAVADFTNETKDPELDGLSEVLIGWLEQSRTLRVLTRGRLAALVREAGKQPDRIDEELAREVGGRAGVEVLLLGSIRRLGESYAVELRAVEPAGDHYLFAVPERAGAKEELFATLERLSERVRERLRERPALIQASKVKVDPLTRSFEAWRHYREGMAKADRWDYGGAIQDFQRAIAVDPDFALAHLRLAEHGEFVGRPVEERRLAIQAALRNIGALPPKERLLVEAWAAHLDGREDEAERLHARALEAYPQDLEVLYQAMDLHYSASRWEEALPLLRRLHALDPGSAGLRAALWACLGALDLADEQLALARAWVERWPWAQTYLAEALGDAGRHDEAIATARRAAEADDRAATRIAWGLALMRAGRHQEAEGVLRPLVDPARAGGPSEYGIANLATALDYQGRHREALAAVAAIPSQDDRDYKRLMHSFCLSCRLAPGEAVRLARAVLATGYHASEWLPLHLLMHGEEREAAALAPRFFTGGPGIRQYQALLAWKHGERERAVAEMEALARRGPSYSRPSAVYFLAAFAHEARRDRDVVTLVETLGRAPPQPGWHAVAYPEAALWAAQAHERLGQRDRTRAGVERLLGAWARADPDLPLLAEAKALCRRVGWQPTPASPGGKP